MIEKNEGEMLYIYIDVKKEMKKKGFSVTEAILKIAGLIVSQSVCSQSQIAQNETNERVNEGTL